MKSSSKPFERHKLYQRLSGAGEAFLKLPGKMRFALSFGAVLLLFNAMGAASYWGLWEKEVMPGYRAFVALLAAGNLLALIVITMTLRCLLEHIARADLASNSVKNLQNFMNSASEAIYGIDLEGHCTFCNRACLRLLGYGELSQLLGRDMDALVFANLGAEGQGCQMTAAMRSEKNLHIDECQAQRADGSSILVECRSNLVYENNKVVGAAVTLLDISRPKALREVLLRDQESLEMQVRELSQHSKELALFGQLAEMLQACASTPEFCRIVSAFAKDLFPNESGALYILEPAHLILDPQISWGDAPPPAPAFFRLQDCWSLRRGRPHYQENSQEEIFCAHVSGTAPAFTFCLPLVGQGTTLGLLHLRAGKGGQLMASQRQMVAVSLAHQVALGLSNLRLKEILRDEAIRDPVTGLFNMRFMNESLDHEIQRAQRTGTSVGLIAFDLDHFKEVNDTLGHAAGDSLLAVLANLAKGSLRSEDISCRQGGDEFLLILPDITENETLAFAEVLREKADEFTRIQFPSLAGKITLSAGVAMFPKDGATPKELQKAADRALYRAKTLGRNQVFAASQLGVSVVP